MEDQATIYKTFIVSHKVLICDYAGYHYVQDGESVCRSPMSNKKVLDSIKGYLASVQDPNLPKECYNSAIQGFVNCYLMMYPRYKKQSNNLIIGGQGKITITCPKCQKRFNKRT